MLIINCSSFQIDLILHLNLYKITSFTITLSLHIRSSNRGGSCTTVFTVSSSGALHECYISYSCTVRSSTFAVSCKKECCYDNKLLL